MTDDSSGKVLIVDDEELSVEFLAALLRDEYELAIARNGFEAVELAREFKPDVILMDIMMPVMDGYEALRHIIEIPDLTDIPVLFITAMTKIESEIKGLELGAHDYLAKPYNATIVKLRVKNHVRFKRHNDLVKEQRDQLSAKNRELEKTLARVRRLEGIITICMYCKQIRTAKDSWSQIEKYISDHSEVRFSHGICPECYASVQKS